MADFLKHALQCYGPMSEVCYVRWAPSSSATQTLTEAYGVTSVTRSAIGSYVVNLKEPCKALVAFAQVIDNSTTNRSIARIDSSSASAGTIAVKHEQNSALVAVTTRIADVSTASSAYVNAPIAGTVVAIYSSLGGAISGANSAITTAIQPFAGGGFVAITNGGFTVAQASSAAGDADSATPTAANTVAVGDTLRATTDGGSTDAATLDVTFVIAPTVGSDTVDEIEVIVLCRKHN